MALENDAAYCFRNLPFSFGGAQVTIDYGHVPSGVSEQAEFAKGNPFSDCNSGSADAEVATSDGTSFSPQAFHVVFYK